MSVVVRLCLLPESRPQPIQTVHCSQDCRNCLQLLGGIHQCFADQLSLPEVSVISRVLHPAGEDSGRRLS